MKAKSLILLFWILSFFSNVSAQFIWSNPTVQNNNIKDIHIFSASEAIAVAEVGTLLRTTNGGATWSVNHVISGFYNELNSVVFIDNINGWICGQNGLIIRTTDGGKNWFSVFSGTDNDLRKIFYVAPNHFWVVGDNGTILYSLGGNTFVQQASNTFQRLNSVFFTSSQNGIITANNGIILRTTNGGSTWLKIPMPIERNLNGVYFPSALRGYVVGDSGRVYRTNNGGVSWTMIAFSDTVSVTLSDLKSCFFLDDNRGWIAGKESRIFYTSNGGTSLTDWTYQPSPTWRQINVIKFANNFNGFAVGEWGTILRTSDGGQFWSNVNKGEDEYLNKVWFANKNVGWAAGDRGVMLKTTNGGALWFKVPCFNYWGGALTADINAVRFLDPFNGFAIGDSGYFAYTLTGGDVWYFYHYDSLRRMDDLWDLEFLDNFYGVVVGGYWNSPVFLRTTDRGQTWSRWIPGDYGDKYYAAVPFAVDMLNYSVGWTAGTTGIIRKTTNGGLSWRYYDPPFYGDWFYDIHFVDDSTGWVVGKMGNLWKTTNGGLSWFQLESLTTKELFSVFFINRNLGFICGADGLIQRSTDGGVTWTVLKKMTNNRLKNIFMLDSLNAWIVGDLGTILKTSNGGATFVDLTESMPDNFNLKQNYPNPFNSTTKIEFSLINKEFVTLKLYDILGREVYSLFEGDLPAGEHQFVFNSNAVETELASGIYFFRLSNKSQQKIIKAVLLK